MRPRLLRIERGPGVSTATTFGPGGPRWEADTVKAAIAAHIPGLVAEWGVKLTGKKTQKGWLECHAVGREDSKPSAAINAKSGTYHDLGDSGKGISIFQLGVKLHAYSSFPDAVNSLGERFGVPPTSGYSSGSRSPFSGKAGGSKAKPEAPAEPRVIPMGKPSFEAAVRSVKATFKTHWTYFGVDGLESFRVARFEGPDGKTFRPIHESPGKGWHLSDPPGQLPLYRLPELLSSAPDATVFVLEGEKIADLAAGLGLVATTSSHGSGSPGLTDWSHLAGRDVVIVPDNDKPGEGYRDKVAVLLSALDPKPTVRTLVLPGINPGEDFEQWLENAPDGWDDQATAAAFRDLVASSAEPLVVLDPEPDTIPFPNGEKPKRAFYTLADAAAIIGDTRWVWKDWIPAGCMSILAAVGGGGKTRTSMDLARRLWFGLAMPDGSPNPFPAGTKTLWIMYDRNFGETIAVARNFGVPLEAISLASIEGSAIEPPDFDDPRTMEDLKTQIEECNPGLVFVDTVTYATNLNTCKANEAKVAFDGIIKLATSTGVAVLALTHLSKDGEVLGRRISERARSVILLSLPDPEGQPNRRKIWVDKTAIKKADPLGITFTDASNDYDDAPPEAPDEPDGRPAGKKRGPSATVSSERAEWIFDQLSKGGMRVGDLIEAAKADLKIESPSPLYAAMRRLPVVKPGWRVKEGENTQGRKTWTLERTDDAEDPMADHPF